MGGVRRTCTNRGRRGGVCRPRVPRTTRRSARGAPASLVHGDAKLETLGLDGDRLVAIDWGEPTGIGPAQIDVALFAVMSGWRLDWLPGETFAAYEQQAG